MIKRLFSLLLAVSMMINMMPVTVLADGETDSGNNELAGKTISILGASISTFAGTSNGAAAESSNSTIKDNAAYYPNSNIPEVTLNDTWWKQAADDLGLRLLVCNTWSGSSLLHTRAGTVGAYVERCVQLHDDTGDNAGEEPDIIAIQMGTNDFQYYKDTLGTADIDYAFLITENEDGSFTYAEPTTSLEAAAIVLHKISVRYPDAEVYYLNLSQRVDDTDDVLKEFNENLEAVCADFDVPVVDIFGSAITKEDFDKYIGDGRVHPNNFGMDAYTEAFKKALFTNTKYDFASYTISFELDEKVQVDYGTDKQVLAGAEFSCNLTAEDGYMPSVTVTMNGEDITADCYTDGVIFIESVTGDVLVKAEAVVQRHDPQTYRWEFDGTDLVSVADTENKLTKTAGSTADGVFNKTCYELSETIYLLHDMPWSVEWKSSGTWRNSSSSSGGRLFTTSPLNADYNARYLFKSANSYLIAMGEKDTKGSHNYGIALSDHNIDGSEEHIYRLTNRIADDGSNMIYLSVDGVEIGAMNHYYVGTKNQNTVSDWLSGKDFIFPYIGTDTHGLTNCSIEYLQIWEDGVEECLGAPGNPISSHWPMIDTDLTHIIGYGQSFSTGADAPVYADPTVDGVYVYGGITNSTNGTDLNPLPATGSQHPIISAGNSLAQMLQNAGYDTDIILGSYGTGGRTIAQLMSVERQAQIKEEEGYDYDINNSGKYAVFQSSVSAIASYAEQTNQTVSCPVIVYLQGETDQNTDEQLGYPENPVRAGYGAGGDKEKYKEYMSRLKEDMQNEVMKAYGQTEKPLFLIYQVSGTYVRTDYSSINMAQIEFAQENEDVILVQTPYFTPHYTNSHHLTVNGYRWLGEYIAQSIYTALVDREKLWPMMPESIELESDTTIRILVNNTDGGLCIDRYTVEDATNKTNLLGFNLWVDGKNIVPEEVEVSDDEIILILPAKTDLSSASSVSVQYAGRRAKGTGNIRDNSHKNGYYEYLDDSADTGVGNNQGVSYSAKKENGDSLIGSKYPLYNWLASFSYDVNGNDLHVHKYTETVVAPTCISQGYTVYSCACGSCYAKDFSTATGIHEYQSIVSPPTCASQGYTTHSCTICSDSYTDTLVAATGHTYGDWITSKEATCTEAGSQRRDCVNCEAYETQELPMKGHNYESVATLPTCTEIGYTTHSCTACGDIYTDTLVAATGHQFVNGKCSVCGEKDSAWIWGDVNNDSLIDSYDATLILKYDVGMISGDSINLAVADVSGDGYVDSYDATLILKYDVGMIDTFPAA